MEETYREILDKAELNSTVNKKLANRLKKGKGKNLDDTIHDLHEEAFETIDCMKCANCCKTTSPIFRDVDIERLSKHLGMKAVNFVSTYLHLDEARDYVLNTAPCPFLGDDNYCSVYDARPKACSEYPHTDRKNQQQILSLSLKNTLVCPAVAQIFEQLQKK